MIAKGDQPVIDANRCPQCDASLPAGDAPERLCPRCLFAAAIEVDDATDAEILEGLVGRTIDGKYRIERLLGRGGMGAVYLATHVGTERHVALKVLAPHLMDDEEFVGRFRREARAAGRLRHPNIVNVTDFGFSEVGDDQLLAYLVMEYLDGTSLADHVSSSRDHPLTWVGDVVEQIALAVDEAHRHGVIHRDLKPANIWLVPDGRGGHLVKVLDFGLAKLRDTVVAEPAPSAAAAEDGAPTVAVADREPVRRARGFGAWRSAARITGVRRVATTLAGEPPSGAEGLTRVGSILGTPLYMSPEQCRGEAIDGRSDVYALGVIAYELLTGCRPFKGDTHELVAQHVERLPKLPSEIRTTIPRSVDGALLPALAKHREERPATAGEFARSLRTSLDAAEEDSVSIFGRAFGLYGKNFWTFLRLSPASGVIPCAIGAAVGLLVAWSSVWWIGVPALFALAAAGWVVGGVVNAGVVTPLVAGALESPDERVPAVGRIDVRWSALPVYVLATLWPSSGLGQFALVLLIVGHRLRGADSIGFDWIWPLWLAFYLGMLGVGALNMSLTGAVALLEGRELRETLDRANALAHRVREVYQSTFSRGETLVSLLTVWLVLMAVVVSASQNAVGSISIEGPGLALFVAAATVAGVVLNPILGICYALKYLKARQLGGESISTIAPEDGGEGGACAYWSRPDGGHSSWLESGDVPPSIEVWRRLPTRYLTIALGLFVTSHLAAFLCPILPFPLSTLVSFVIAGLPIVWFNTQSSRAQSLILDDQGVGYLGVVRGVAEVRWDEVTRAKCAGDTISLRGPNGYLYVELSYYGEADEVYDYMTYQLRRHGKIP